MKTCRKLEDRVIYQKPRHLFIETCNACPAGYPEPRTPNPELPPFL
jgi:hypothetical protein